MVDNNSLIPLHLIYKLGHNDPLIRYGAFCSIHFKLENNLINLLNLIYERRVLIQLLEWFNKQEVTASEEVLSLILKIAKHPSGSFELCLIGGLSFFESFRKHLDDYSLSHLVDEILSHLRNAQHIENVGGSTSELDNPIADKLLTSNSRIEELLVNNYINSKEPLLTHKGKRVVPFLEELGSNEAIPLPSFHILTHEDEKMIYEVGLRMKLHQEPDVFLEGCQRIQIWIHFQFPIQHLLNPSITDGLLLACWAQPELAVSALSCLNCIVTAAISLVISNGGKRRLHLPGGSPDNPASLTELFHHIFVQLIDFHANFAESQSLQQISFYWIELLRNMAKYLRTHQVVQTDRLNEEQMRFRSYFNLLAPLFKGTLSLSPDSARLILLVIDLICLFEPNQIPSIVSPDVQQVLNAVVVDEYFAFCYPEHVKKFIPYLHVLNPPLYENWKMAHEEYTSSKITANLLQQQVELSLEDVKSCIAGLQYIDSGLDFLPSLLDSAIHKGTPRDTAEILSSLLSSSSLPVRTATYTWLTAQLNHEEESDSRGTLTRALCEPKAMRALLTGLLSPETATQGFELLETVTEMCDPSDLESLSSLIPLFSIQLDHPERGSDMFGLIVLLEDYLEVSAKSFLYIRLLFHRLDWMRKWAKEKLEKLIAEVVQASYEECIIPTDPFHSLFSEEFSVEEAPLVLSSFSENDLRTLESILFRTGLDVETRCSAAEQLTKLILGKESCIRPHSLDSRFYEMMDQAELRQIIFLELSSSFSRLSEKLLTLLRMLVQRDPSFYSKYFMDHPNDFFVLALYLKHPLPAVRRDLAILIGHALFDRCQFNPDSTTDSSHPFPLTTPSWVLSHFEFPFAVEGISIGLEGDSFMEVRTSIVKSMEQIAKFVGNADLEFYEKYSEYVNKLAALTFNKSLPDGMRLVASSHPWCQVNRVIVSHPNLSSTLSEFCKHPIQDSTELFNTLKHMCCHEELIAPLLLHFPYLQKGFLNLKNNMISRPHWEAMSSTIEFMMLLVEKVTKGYTLGQQSEVTRVIEEVFQMTLQGVELVGAASSVETNFVYVAIPQEELTQIWKLLLLMLQVSYHYNQKENYLTTVAAHISQRVNEDKFRILGALTHHLSMATDISEKCYLLHNLLILTSHLTTNLPSLGQVLTAVLCNSASSSSEGNFLGRCQLLYSLLCVKNLGTVDLDPAGFISFHDYLRGVLSDLPDESTGSSQWNFCHLLKGTLMGILGVMSAQDLSTPAHADLFSEEIRGDIELWDMALDTLADSRPPPFLRTECASFAVNFLTTLKQRIPQTDSDEDRLDPVETLLTSSRLKSIVNILSEETATSGLLAHSLLLLKNITIIRGQHASSLLFENPNSTVYFFSGLLNLLDTKTYWYRYLNLQSERGNPCTPFESPGAHLSVDHVCVAMETILQILQILIYDSPHLAPQLALHTEVLGRVVGILYFTPEDLQRFEGPAVPRLRSLLVPLKTSALNTLNNLITGSSRLRENVLLEFHGNSEWTKEPLLNQLGVLLDEKEEDSLQMRMAVARVVASLTHELESAFSLFDENSAGRRLAEPLLCLFLEARQNCIATEPSKPSRLKLKPSVPSRDSTSYTPEQPIRSVVTALSNLALASRTATESLVQGGIFQTVLDFFSKAIPVLTAIQTSSAKVDARTSEVFQDFSMYAGLLGNVMQGMKSAKEAGVESGLSLYLLKLFPLCTSEILIQESENYQSSIMDDYFRILKNFTADCDRAKKTLLYPEALLQKRVPHSTYNPNEKTILHSLVQLVLKTKTSMRLLEPCCGILKSLSLCHEARHALQKHNFMQECIALIQKYSRDKSHKDHVPAKISVLLEVLTVMSFSTDIHGVLYKIPGLFDLLCDLIDNFKNQTHLLVSTDIQRSCFLILRNLAFFADAKTHILNQGSILSRIIDAVNSTDSEISLITISTLWVLLHNNQRARMKLKTEMVLNKLEEVDFQEIENKDEIVGKKLRTALEGLRDCLGC